MSDIDIKIKSTFDSAGTDAARKSVEGLGRSGTGLDKLGAAAVKAATEHERLAQAVAKTATATNQAATAAQKLATEEQRTAAAASNAAAAQTRAEKAALSLAQANAKAAQSAQQAGGYFAKMGESVSAGIAGIVGPAAAAGVALGALKGAADLTVAAASAQQTRGAFDQLAKAAGTTGDALMTALRSASGGEINDLNLQLAANRAQLLGVADSAQEFSTLMEIARDRAQKMGISTTQAFNDLVTGLGRGSPLILDNLGITVNLTEANNSYAASLGKSADALSDTEKKQALINAVLKDGAASMAATGGAVDSNAASFARAGAAISNLGNAIGGALANVAGPAADAFADLAGAAQGSEQSFGAAMAGAQTLISTMQGFGPTTQAAADANQAFADRVANGGTTLLTYLGIIQPATGATQAHAGALLQSADAEDRRANATRGGIIEQQASTAATINDTMAKQASQAQTQLLEAQTNAAASAFLALHPGITASGVASLAAAGQIDPLIAQLIQARMRALDAANALAQFNALQGVKATVVKPREAQNEIAGLKRDNVASDRQARAQVAAAEYAAQKERTLAIGTNAQKIALYQKEYDAAVKMYGAGSVEAFKAQTKVLDAQQQGTTKRVGAANTAAAKLEGIEQKTGDKLTDIVSKTQDKLAAVDAKGAEQRLAAAKRLNQALAANAADRRASSEADDLDLVGPMDDKEAAKLNDRERAQASAREREKAAAAEARAGIERGEAETAEKVYAAREEQIQAQQQLDESYYAKQRELADNPEAQAALKQQYDEGVRAADEAAQMRIMFAKAEAEEAAGAAAEEKARIIAEAEEQANKVIGASERSAAGVKKATADASNKAIADIRAIGDSINALPAEKRIKINVDGSGGGGAAAAGKSDGAYAGGGSFMTQGPTNITVGDNPGGAELVTVVPLSGSGQTRAAPGTIALAGGGSVLADAGDGYTTPIAGSGSSSGKAKKGKGGGSTAAAAKDQIAEQKAAIDLLSDLIKLRHDMAAELENGTPFDVAFAERLSKVAADFARFVRAALPTSTKAETEAFKLSADNTKQSIGILSDMVDLRKDLSDWQSVNPIDLAFVQRLAATAAEVTRLVMSQLVPTTEVEVDRLKRWAELNGAAVGIIKDIGSLNQKMFSDYVAPSDAQLDGIVKDADRIARRMVAAAAAYDTKGLAAAKSFTDAVGGTFGAFKDGLLFFQALNSGDFVLNEDGLAKFEGATLKTMAVAKRLGAEAATIPSTDLAALQLTTQALAAQSEALIKLAAVPFGDLPGAAANLNAQAAQLLGGYKGGGGAVTNIYNTFQMPPGTPAQLVEMVIQRLGQQVNARK